MKIATKRAVLLQAWRVAQKRIEQEGVAQLNPDEEAGRLLAKYAAANVAHTLCENRIAREHLAEVVREDGSYVLPERDAL